jgi:hypothetical protein
MRCLACAIIVLAWADSTHAQQSAGDIYTTAGVAFPCQAALDPASAPPFPAPGGMTVGWLAGGGVFLPAGFSLEGELSRTGTMTSSHDGRHYTGQSATRRDWFLSVGLKRHFDLRSTFGVEPIVGLVLVGDQGTYENTHGSAFGTENRYSGYYPIDWVHGVMFGVDFRIGGRRLAFTPGLRFAFTNVPTGQDCVVLSSGGAECRDDAERWKYRHPRWTLRPAAALRVVF